MRSRIRGVALAVATAVGSVVGSPASAEPLGGDDIRAALSGVTLHGVYGDGSRFSEMYAPNGALSYFDAETVATGDWSVEGDRFCTTYSGDEMTSGCFAVERESANCLLFFSAGEPGPAPVSAGKGRKAPDAAPPVTATASLVARGWDEATPTTCEGLEDMPEIGYASPDPAMPGPGPDARSPAPPKRPQPAPSAPWK